MRKTSALIFALIGMLFIRVAMWLDSDAIIDVALGVGEKLLKDKPPARKLDPSGLYPKYGNTERYTIEDFEEPY